MELLLNLPTAVVVCIQHFIKAFLKLMSHTMMLWERVVEARLRAEVSICEQQCGFMPKKRLPRMQYLL